MCIRDSVGCVWTGAGDINNHMRWSLINTKFQSGDDVEIDGCYFGKWDGSPETSTVIGGINLRRLAVQNGFVWNPVFSDTTGTLTDAIVRADIQWDTVETVGSSTELVQQFDFTDIDNNALFDILNDGDTIEEDGIFIREQLLNSHTGSGVTFTRANASVSDVSIWGDLDAYVFVPAHEEDWTFGTVSYTHLTLPTNREV